jgi:hypothetical protein
VVAIDLSVFSKVVMCRVFNRGPWNDVAVFVGFFRNQDRGERDLLRVGVDRVTDTGVVVFANV